MLAGIAIASCALEDADDVGPPITEEQQPVSYPSQYCVDDYGHWHFYGDCAEDVSLGAGSTVTAASSGTVALVYASCGGYAGQSVRVQGAEGKYMYAHINTSLSNGAAVTEGEAIGTVYDGAGPVYCNASLSSCGVGYSVAEGRTTECWSGPHLHREAPCCPGCQDPGGDSSECTFGAGCAADGSPCDYCYADTCSSSYIGTNDGCDCGCGVHDPDCSSGPVCGNGSCESGEDCASCAADCGSCGGCTYYCSDYGYSPGQCVSGWECNWPCIDYTGCSSGPVCGNGSCESGEDCASCAADCGSCGGCTYYCSDYGYSPGQCVSGWECNWPCIDYTGC
jgi:hypothetical protein